MIPSCFSSPNNVARNSHTQQNLITCIYQTQLCNNPIYLTLTWSKSNSTHSLTIHASDVFSLMISFSSSALSLFRNKVGSKPINLMNSHRVKIYWDFTRAEFSHKSAEPKSSFYIAIIWDSQVEFFLGDLLADALRRVKAAKKMSTFVDPILLSRREHVFGHQNYSTNVQLLGSKHELGIECSSGVLKVKVDGVVSLVVKRLAWKFRGNERIKVGELEVEFYWDVFNWVGGAGGSGGVNGDGYGVFVFQVGDDHGGVWPEMVGPENKLMKRKSMSMSSQGITSSPTPSCSSVLQWAEESSSDGGRSSCCSSSTTRSDRSSGGFSLLLYAWKSD